MANLNYSANKMIASACMREKVVKFFMLLCAATSVLVSVGILFSMLFESYRFFRAYPLFSFLFGTHWSPQLSDVGEGSFGVIPLLLGTVMITGIALLVAIPFGVLSAIYLAEFASWNFRKVAKPILEILAGIPTVVYGFFAVIFISPLVRTLGGYFGVQIAAESALAAGLAMGIMIIPFVSSLVDNALRSVPDSLRLGAYGLGSTRAEAIIKVIFPAALPGIIGSFILAFSRAIGETMIVVMAAGLMAKISFNPLDSLTTITVQIVTALTGDQEFDDVKTLSAFALGIFLFFMTLLMNVLALYIVNKYSEKYE